MGRAHRSCRRVTVCFAFFAISFASSSIAQADALPRVAYESERVQAAGDDLGKPHRHRVTALLRKRPMPGPQSVTSPQVVAIVALIGSALVAGALIAQGAPPCRRPRLQNSFVNTRPCQQH